MNWRKLYNDVRSSMAKDWPCESKYPRPHKRTTCDLRWDHEGLHQHREVSLSGSVGYWLWSTDGIVTGFVSGGHPGEAIKALGDAVATPGGRSGRARGGRLRRRSAVPRRRPR